MYSSHKKEIIRIGKSNKPHRAPKVRFYFYLFVYNSRILCIFARCIIIAKVKDIKERSKIHN
ncbi:hypothetical protein HMPREF1551_01669 [Capnocytophaga sp. oral taxon 863 str. F0517]|nr:hypothetical protein HMPREF1551_01669 [Capnocytophaga sp. oral taxon 863 str. F0517]